MQEYHRYGPGLGPPGFGWLLRPGFWAMIIALPISAVALGRRALATCDSSARALILPTLLFPALFGVFITLKLVNYTLIELPLFALAIAWGLSRVWTRAPLRPLLAAIGAAVLVEGAFAFARLDQAAATTTPYTAFVASVRQYLPPGAHILGLHSYWLGLQDFDYRSFLVPLNWADEGLPLDDGLARVAPDVVLMDARMRAYFLDSPDGARLNSFLAEHSAEPIGRVDDPTYGLMEIYRVVNR
jgi:hypothetical protein